MIEAKKSVVPECQSNEKRRNNICIIRLSISVPSERPMNHYQKKDRNHSLLLSLLKKKKKEGGAIVSLCSTLYFGCFLPMHPSTCLFRIQEFLLFPFIFFHSVKQPPVTGKYILKSYSGGYRPISRIKAAQPQFSLPQGSENTQHSE